MRWSRSSEDDWLKMTVGGNTNFRGGGSGSLCLGLWRYQIGRGFGEGLGAGSLNKISLAHFGSEVVFPEVAV